MTPASRATGATLAALATQNSPSLIGRPVCTHAASDVGVPSTASHLARWVAVTSAAKTAVWRRCKVRRSHCTFAGPRQDCMSACAHWVSARAATAAHVRANWRVVEGGVDRYYQHLRALLQKKACRGC